MQISVQGKQIDVGDALRDYVSGKIEDIDAKFFNRAVGATVLFSREGQSFFKAHIAIHVGRQIKVMGEAVENDIYQAFDAACAKVARQMGRYKNRLRTHHRKLEQTPESENLKAHNYVLATRAQEPPEEEKDEFEADHPLIVAEIAADIEIMSVSEAVMRMDLADQAAFLFRNASHNGLNLVYRRTDGHVGWVDPQIESAAK